ncbi:MAG: DUF4172 domain-containing protein [Methylococcaceae bacterium]|nr:DUF4172 domain-containing protein [Methylococcaceae bacterium]
MTQNLWNWQRKEWPNFSYDENALKELEYDFSKNTGMIIGAFKHINNDEKNHLIVDIMSGEALKTSEIEGAYLNRNSIQTSIRKNLGLETDKRKVSPEEYGIAEMMVELFKNYNQPLSEQVLFDWHKMLTNGRRDLDDIGRYRTHEDDMQIVSGRLDKPKIYFQAPPSHTMQQEMSTFLNWFNKSQAQIFPLARAGIAHFYFINIHPFEDGNGRIGRAIAEKSIAQSIGRPALLSLSQVIQRNKKAYYAALGNHNKTCEITDWLLFFAQTILEAQEHTLKQVDFFIEKAKFFDCFSKNINERQKKVIKRLFDAGYQGFEGGLSADNYINITRTSASTATRDLQQMVEKKILIRRGERKGTRYYLNIKYNKDV